MNTTQGWHKMVQYQVLYCVAQPTGPVGLVEVMNLKPVPKAELN